MQSGSGWFSRCSDSGRSCTVYAKLEAEKDSPYVFVALVEVR
jgi:hypothetical protein